jgi:hypothetical protein
MIHTSSVPFAALIVSATLLTTPARAQAPATCGSLITDAELAKVVGTPMRAIGNDVRGPGHTECKWMLAGQGAFKTVAVIFEDESALKSAHAATSASLFETYVSSAEQTGKSKRSPLPGVGQRAAIIDVSEQTQVIVQRTDGVARIITNGLSRPQVTAIAQALMTP